MNYSDICRMREEFHQRIDHLERKIDQRQDALRYQSSGTLSGISPQLIIKDEFMNDETKEEVINRELDIQIEKLDGGYIAAVDIDGEVKKYAHSTKAQLLKKVIKLVEELD